jgi:hypothetical protein
MPEQHFAFFGQANESRIRQCSQSKEKYRAALVS